MIRFLTELLIMGLIVCVCAYLIPGVSVNNFLTAMIAAILIALTNSTIGTILRLLTFPVNFLTLGLVSFIITVLMILLVSKFLEGFEVSGFWPAVLFALVAAVLKMAYKILAPTEKK